MNNEVVLQLVLN